MPDPVQPVENTPTSPTPPPGDSIPLSRKEYDELMAARRDLEAVSKERDLFKGRWSNTEKLLKTNVDPKEQAAAVRSVMADAGYTPAQIEAYLRKDTEDGEDAQGEDDGASNASGSRKRAARSVNPDDVDDMRRDMQGLASTMQAQIQERLQAKFDTTLESVLDQHEGLDTLIKARTHIEFGENADPVKVREFTKGLRREIASELARDLREKLTVKRAQNQGGWKDEWIPEQAAEAAKAVHSRWRTFMGDPGRIGRIGETSMGTESLSAKKPVPEPVYKKGMSSSEAQAQSRDWAVDYLLRGIHDSGADSRA